MGDAETRGTLPLEGGIPADLFRQIFQRWPSGVAVITSRDGAVRQGMVASSFCSLSLDPPLVMFSAGHKTRTYPVIDRSGVFAASILGAGQIQVFDRFAGHDRAHDADRFADLATAEATTGCPVFRDALAWMDCKVVEKHTGPGYTIFVGEIVAASLGTAADGDPLVYFRREIRFLKRPGAGG